MQKEKTVEETYKQLSQYEHILQRPDTYVGSLEMQKDKLWVYDLEEDKLEYREVSYVPGLFKIFDEIIVNAADNYQRDNSMSFIDVTIDEKAGKISVKNGGKGIPIEIHKEYKIYVPELIFGRLLTSSNYDDNVKKVTGGRNGYGAKLTNIFSKEFIVETADKKNKKYYKQIFSNNMLEKTEPEIKKNKDEDYTCITFTPDLSKFKMEKFDKDIVSLFTKRVYDLAGVTPKSVKVSLNGKVLEVKDFSSYIDKYIEASKDEDEEFIKVYEEPHERWQVGFTLSDGQFQQVSFVNSICTTKGGTHVNYVIDKIIDSVIEKVRKKEKNLDIKPQHIKAHIWIFVNCLIENSSFDSQTKETLTLKKEQFGSSFEFSEKFLKNVVNSGIIDTCIKYAHTREQAKALRKLNPKGKKKDRVIGIDKLDDANLAGSKESENCTLILTEGDSAKSLAVAGIESMGDRDHFGCFPLRGKMLNVRDASMKQILRNQEVINLMKILGIKIDTVYSDIKQLRYGHIMIMTDQDVDGSHIKGLIINFIQFFWPSLIKIDGFMTEFITPIIRATKGAKIISFYSLPDYKNWLIKQGGTAKGWKIKYYKGLGTSTNKEAQEYFSEIDKSQIFFEYKDTRDDDDIDLAFNKKKAENRKQWLGAFDPSQPPLPTNIKRLSYTDFIRKELILFSIYDNQRSIPSLCDGLKPSERKILFGCFKRNLKDEIKVAQLVGYISEHTAYHHGEQSLSGTIVAMAQNFVGSNNINLLLPLGQFGSRAAGGKDSASPRYIFTNLSKVTRVLFNQNDLPLMKYIVEEGQRIEPEWYLPIIPLILVNGTSGIGTGWSTDIPCFDPRAIIASIKNKILKGTFLPLDPWYKGYTGIIKKTDKQGVYDVLGKFTWEEDTLIINELPIKKWTKDYKNFIETLMGADFKNSEKEEGGKKKKKEEDNKSKDNKPSVVLLSGYRQNHSINKIRFEIDILPEYLEEFKKSDSKVMKTFKLQSSLSLTNMVLFDKDGKLKKYDTVEKILDEFFQIRLVFYDKRKKYTISVLDRDLLILKNKVRFIREVVEDKFIIKKVKKTVLIDKLFEAGYDPMSRIDKLKIKTDEEKNAELEELKNHSDNEEENQSNNINKVSQKDYDYLLNMQLWSLTYEKIEELEKQKKDKECELNKIKNLKIEDMWIMDLDNLLEVLDECEDEEKLLMEEQEKLEKKRKKNNKGVKVKQRRKRKNKTKDDDSTDNITDDISQDDGKKNGGKGRKKKQKEGTIDTFLTNKNADASDDGDDSNDDQPFKAQKNKEDNNNQSRMRDDMKYHNLQKRRKNSTDELLDMLDDESEVSSKVAKI